MTDKSFQKAVEDVKILLQKPEKDELSTLYGLYKQATVGDVNIDRPGILDFTGRGKWDAWNIHKGLTLEEAKAKYIELVEKLKDKYGI